jgi:site-specific DNA recombinase
LRLILGRLEDFATKVQHGLAEADWTRKRDLIRALVKRVEVARDDVTLVLRIDPSPGEADPEKKSLPLCRGSAHTLLEGWQGTKPLPGTE